jgi:hypothetical protein
MASMSDERVIRSAAAPRSRWQVAALLQGKGRRGGTAWVGVLQLCLLGGVASLALLASGVSSVSVGSCGENQ